MPDSEKHECEECGRTFDSERGLHIHQSQVHAEETSSLRPKSFKPWILAFLIIVLSFLFLNYSDYQVPQVEPSPAKESTTKQGKIGDGDVIRHRLKIVVGSQNTTVNSSHIESPN